MLAEKIRPLTVGMAGLLLAGVAQATVSDYRCPGGQVLHGSYTPREVRLELGTQRWTLARVPQAGEVRYVNRPEGVSLSVARQQATLERTGQSPLVCERLMNSPPAQTLRDFGATNAR